MVLTTFECWANAGCAGNISADIEHHQLGDGAGVAGARHVDLFNPRAVQQNLGQVPHVTPTSAGVSHISSNGYYGFSYVNAAHELNNNNNNNDAICNNNNNACNHNLNVAAVRCKKRFFVNDEDEADLFAKIANCNPAKAGVDSAPVHGHQFAAEPTVAKRCRYDDDYAAQYFNDFFNMQAATAPPPQIGTMSCLMDTEDFSQSQQEQQLQQQQLQPSSQQQVDVAMTATSLHTNYAPNDVECNLSSINSFQGNNKKLVRKNNNHEKSMQEENASYFTKDSIKSLSTHVAVATETAELNESNRLLLQTSTTLETLFAATHGGSQYHYWQCCSKNKSTNDNNNNFVNNKPSQTSDENFFEEF